MRFFFYFFFLCLCAGRSFQLFYLPVFHAPFKCSRATFRVPSLGDLTSRNFPRAFFTDKLPLRLTLVLFSFLGYNPRGLPPFFFFGSRF